MKLSDSMRAVQGISDVVMPDDFAIGRIQKWNSIPPKVERAAGGTFGISLSLRQYALWPERQLLGFDNADNLAIHAKCVIGGAVLSFELLNSTTVVGRERR